MKEETVVYIRVPASEEKPEYEVWVTLFLSSGFMTVGARKPDRWQIFNPYDLMTYAEIENERVDYWLKPVPLPSLLQEGAVEFAEWLRTNYFYYEKGWVTNQEGLLMSYDEDREPDVYFTASELFKLFIEEKHAKETK